jgi:diguanylate cyclase (GGDEF)-like protein
MAADEISPAAELQRLVALIQELTSKAARSESAGELFARCFPSLFQCVDFDLGVAVMIEQNLDLYITTRAGAGALVDEALVTRIRATLAQLIPVSFETTEVVVKAESHDLPAAEVAPLRFETHALIKQQNRIAGVVMISRAGSPFNANDRQILEIFATQISLLLGMIRAREQIVSLAETDDLTGIWNKRFFRRQLPQEIERARTYNIPLSLLLFDIDDFKEINDSLGHVIGDVVLSELCGAVREMLRPPDFFARFGGDEFAVILPHTDLPGASSVAERILATVRKLTIPTDEEGAIQCSISIGIAEYDDQRDVSGNDLVRRADEKLYVSKRQGKNRYTL